MAQLTSTTVNGNLSATGTILAGEIKKNDAEAGEILMADGSSLFMTFDNASATLYISTQRPD
jgi:hypothetical protein